LAELCKKGTAHHHVVYYQGPHLRFSRRVGEVSVEVDECNVVADAGEDVEQEAEHVKEHHVQVHVLLHLLLADELADLQRRVGDNNE